MFGTFVKYQSRARTRDPRGAGRHRGARHRPKRFGSRPAPASYGCMPMVVGIFFGLDPSWGCCSSRLSPGSRVRLGLLRIMVAGFAKSFENFKLRRRGLPDPPSSSPGLLPARRSARVGAVPRQLQSLVPMRGARRAAVFGLLGWTILPPRGAARLRLVMCGIAIRAMTQKLVD